MTESLVIDASVMVDLLLAADPTSPIASRLSGTALHAPAHFDAEVLSALGRLQRAEQLTEAQVDERVAALATMPVTRHLLPPLLEGAWQRRHNLRLVDALYVELAEQTGATLVTTDAALASTSNRTELLDR